MVFEEAETVIEIKPEFKMHISKSVLQSIGANEGEFIKVIFKDKNVETVIKIKPGFKTHIPKSIIESIKAQEKDFIKIVLKKID